VVAHDGLVHLGEPDERPPLAGEQPGDPVQDLAAGLGGTGLGLGPGDQVVDRGTQVVDDAGEDVLLGLEVVVQRRPGDVQPLAW